MSSNNWSKTPLHLPEKGNANLLEIVLQPSLFVCRVLDTSELLPPGKVSISPIHKWVKFSMSLTGRWCIAGSDVGVILRRGAELHVLAITYAHELCEATKRMRLQI